MTPAGRSLFLFGWYVLAIGVLIAALPNVLLGLLGVPATDEPWIRILGIVVVALSSYYVVGGRNDNLDFSRLTVPARLFVAAGLVVVAVVFGVWQIALFALPDAAGALWTASVLRATSPQPG